MASRAYWSGHIRVSLVAVPVRLFSATTSSERVALHYVDRKTGERVHYQTVIDGDEPISKDRVAKGYEYDKDQYLILDDDDLDQLHLPTSKTLELEAFVRAAEVDPIYFDRPFHVAPDGPVAAEAFATIRQALQSSGTVGIGRIAISGKERVGALQPNATGMLLTTLHAPDEIRPASAYFSASEIGKAGKDEVQLAEQLIKARLTKFDPKNYPDRYQEALKELVQAKLKGKKLVVPKERKTTNVVNLMDALKKSVASSAKSPSKPAASRSRKRVSAA